MNAPTTRIQQKLMKTNGITLNVAQAGPADGPLAILLHGFPEFWYGWRHQIPHLAALGFRVLAPDQRGYNLSDKPEGLRSYIIDRLVMDIVGLITTTGRDKAVIIGHDWGALVAWWLALRFPEKVERLVILNVPHPRIFGKTLKSSPSQMIRSTYAYFFQFPHLPERFISAVNYQPGLQALRRTSLKGSFTSDDLRAYRRAWSQPGALSAMLNWYRAYARYGAERPTEWRVRVPTMMIWGAKDLFLSQSMAEPSINQCDEGELYILRQATHWVQHDRAQRVNELLTQFLT